MEGENNAAHLELAIQDDDREWLLEANSEAESWIVQVENRYKSRKYKERKTSAGVSIYRVPESIKITKQQAYDPLVVSLGPYHHKKHQQLTAMDEYKLQAVDRTLQRLHGVTIGGLLNKVKELKEQIRNCYEDSAIEWDDVPLFWMMTMDACFILEFLRMELPNSSLVFCSRRDDNIKRREIELDILKLENQIPFCILEKILELETEDPGDVPALLAKHLNRFIGGYFRGYPFSPKENGDGIAEDIGVNENEKVIAKLIKGGAYHLLDLSRKVIADFLSNCGSGSEFDIPVKCCGCNVHCGASTCIATPNGVACFTGTSWTAVIRWLLRSSVVDESIIPSAEKLQKAGIRLKASTKGKFHFKRRCFRRSTLFVPQITVGDSTETFLRNLVAFEECQKQTDSPIKRVISSNMWIMDELINSKEDVKLFERADIIKNYMGNEDDVAKIFNDLCIGITAEDDYEHVLKMVNDRYNSQLNVWISEFREEHCSRPWYIVSFVVAMFILVMTLLQTIYTMKS